jgi:hypothetical protein
MAPLTGGHFLSISPTQRNRHPASQIAGRVFRRLRGLHGRRPYPAPYREGVLGC